MSELLHLLTDWVHWAFEIISGGIIGLVLTPLWRRLLARHDKAKHPPCPDRNPYDTYDNNCDYCGETLGACDYMGLRHEA